MKVLCVIPARYASTRLPGKPLKDIAGKPMICRVYDRASEAKKIAAAIVATDDERIYEAVCKHGGQAVMTRKDHPTGTDRLAEVAAKYPDVDLIINVQGDEPLIEPALIDELAAAFEEDDALQMATVCTEIQDKEEQENPNNVKVVMDKNGYALYFSRSLLPYPRHAGTPVYKHIASMPISAISCFAMRRWKKHRLSMPKASSNCEPLRMATASKSSRRHIVSSASIRPKILRKSIRFSARWPTHDLIDGLASLQAASCSLQKKVEGE